MVDWSPLEYLLLAMVATADTTSSCVHVGYTLGIIIIIINSSIVFRCMCNSFVALILHGFSQSLKYAGAHSVIPVIKAESLSHCITVDSRYNVVIFSHNTHNRRPMPRISIRAISCFLQLAKLQPPEECLTLAAILLCLFWGSLANPG